jgi:hypothetical protein
LGGDVRGDRSSDPVAAHEARFSMGPNAGFFVGSSMVKVLIGGDGLSEGGEGIVCVYGAGQRQDEGRQARDAPALAARGAGLSPALLRVRAAAVAVRVAQAARGRARCAGSGDPARWRGGCESCAGVGRRPSERHRCRFSAHERHLQRSRR